MLSSSPASKPTCRTGIFSFQLNGLKSLTSKFYVFACLRDLISGDWMDLLPTLPCLPVHCKHGLQSWLHSSALLFMLPFQDVPLRI